jgi:hypothetical protein
MEVSSVAPPIRLPHVVRHGRVLERMNAVAEASCVAPPIRLRQPHFHFRSVPCSRQYGLQQLFATLTAECSACFAHL